MSNASDPGFMLSMEERQRLLEANVAASLFFRRELLRTTVGWPQRYLTDQGAREVLSVGSEWKVGYAPDSWTRLVDYLRAEGFGYGTLARAGLMTWAESGEAIDRHRDQLMLVARDQRMAPVGFVGIGPDGRVQSVTPTTAIHRPSNVLVGVGEQLDVLGAGAIPVIVDDPMDAVAITKVSRASGGRWAGIPVCGAGLSTAQARLLRRASATSEVVVALMGDEADRRQSAGYLLDLAFFFDRVRAVALPPGQTPATLYLTKNGPQHLRDTLQAARPLILYRASRLDGAAHRMRDLDSAPDPPAHGPAL